MSSSVLCDVFVKPECLLLVLNNYVNKRKRIVASPFKSTNNLFPLVEKDRKGNSGMRELRLTLIKGGSGTRSATALHAPMSQLIKLHRVCDHRSCSLWGTRFPLARPEHCPPCWSPQKLYSILSQEPTLMRIWMDPVAFSDMKYQKLRVQAALDSFQMALMKWALSPRRPTGVASRYMKWPRNKDGI